MQRDFSLESLHTKGWFTFCQVWLRKMDSIHPTVGREFPSAYSLRMQGNYSIFSAFLKLLHLFRIQNHSICNPIFLVKFSIELTLTFLQRDYLLLIFSMGWLPILWKFHEERPCCLFQIKVYFCLSFDAIIW